MQRDWLYLLPEPGHPLTIVRWRDPVVDTYGHDPRSPYTETFWLPVLGPSTVLLLRRLARLMENREGPFELDMALTARSLGLPGMGRHSPFARSLTRCVQFRLAQPEEPGTLGVRKMLPSLTTRQVAGLPGPLAHLHERWQKEQLLPVPAGHRRSGQGTVTGQGAAGAKAHPDGALVRS
ncbi:MAG: hypothetical protein ACYDH5_14305 [Acidimicrobiales bacterium]